MRVTTTGDALDADGYLVTVDTDAPVAVEANGTATFLDITTGTHTVTLSGVDEPCTIQGDAAVTVDVLSDAQASVAFAVDCAELD